MRASSPCARSQAPHIPGISRTTPAPAARRPAAPTRMRERSTTATVPVSRLSTRKITCCQPCSHQAAPAARVVEGGLMTSSVERRRSAGEPRSPPIWVGITPRATRVAGPVSPRRGTEILMSMNAFADSRHVGLLEPPSASAPSARGTKDSGGRRPDQPHSKLAAWSARHKWLVLLTSLLVVVAGVAAMIGVGISTQEPEDQLVGDSAAAYDIIGDADFGDVPTEFIILTDPEGPLEPAAAAELSAEATDAYAGTAGIASVGEPFPGVDGSLVVPLEMVADGEGEAAEFEPSLSVTDGLQDAHPDLKVGQFGDASLSAEFDEVLGEDFQRAEIFSLPVTLVILLLAFGAVVA